MTKCICHKYIHWQSTHTQKKEEKKRKKSLKTWEDIFTANVHQQGKPNVTHKTYNETQQSEMDPVS